MKPEAGSQGVLFKLSTPQQSEFANIRAAVDNWGNVLRNVYLALFDEIRNIFERTSMPKITSATTKNTRESGGPQYSGTVTRITAGKAAKGRPRPKAVRGVTTDTVKIANRIFRMFLSGRNSSHGYATL